MADRPALSEEVIERCEDVFFRWAEEHSVCGAPEDPSRYQVRELVDRLLTAALESHSQARSKAVQGRVRTGKVVSPIR
jgi:hypothetical protein